MSNPWETPEQLAHAEASDRARRSRASRQTRVFWSIVAGVLLVGLIAAAVAQGWFGTGSSAKAAPCPAVKYDQPATITVNVLNSTRRKGLAGGVAKQLKARGFVVAAVGNASPGVAGKAPALVIYGPNGARGAATLQMLAKGATTRLDPSKPNSIDFIIGDAYKALTPAAEVTKAIAPPPSPQGCKPAN